MFPQYRNLKVAATIHEFWEIENPNGEPEEKARAGMTLALVFCRQESLVSKIE
jgi:hypothetical protein